MFFKSSLIINSVLSTFLTGTKLTGSFGNCNYILDFKNFWKLIKKIKNSVAPRIELWGACIVFYSSQKLLSG